MTYFSYYTRATGVNLVYIPIILYAIILYRPQYTNSLNYTFEKDEYHEHNNNNIIQHYVIIYV